MDLMRLLRTDLLCLCEELGVEVEQKMKKSEISKAISESAEAEEIKIAWELLQNAKSEAAVKEEREQEQAAAREERAQTAATEERALRRLELEIEQQRLNSQNSRVGAPVRASETESYQMKKLMQPFKVGEDVGLFLVNFERTCEKLSFAPELWPQRLLTLLPCEAAEVVARLSAGDADDYDKVKSSLLKRYRLSAEAFRQRFRNASKKSSEGYSEFAYGLKTNLIEWLKSEEVYESRDKVVECVCLEQFFRSIPQSVKLWVQDRVGVDSVERAAELAEEYATRRKLSGEEMEPGRSDQRKTFRQGNGSRENGPEKPEAGQKFQSFSQFRSNVNKKTAEEIEVLNQNPKIWNVHSVLNVLHSLVDKSNINLQLEVYTKGGDPDNVAGEFGRHPLYKMLGYFSLIGLLRLHSLLGDYYQAIKVLENLELNKKSLYSRVPACQITTYYYVGFAYLMMRRYADAIRTFSNILVYIQRTKHMFQQRSYQVDQINKQTEKMYALLAICLTLHPQRIDESILSQLKDKYGDRMNKMQKGDKGEFGDMFTFACPKFLNPVPPVMTAPVASSDKQPPKEQKNFSKEPLEQQLNVFLSEVQGQIMLPTIRSFLKLYTTMPVSKLANFLDKGNEPDSFHCHLLSFKHKMKNVVWTKGSSSLDGEFQSGSDVDFFIDGDMIHIADTKVARRYGDFYIRQYHKFEEVRCGGIAARKGGCHPEDVYVSCVNRLFSNVTYV
ncbi:hypothetical protein HPB47_013544 [Ixodes persulcatus]|uniref:Uncharacterized protein n=1 Tax=Ixodes persulcatus TaxID=34615 RepID=A0AC60R0T7_IXOPE|nr:hypothetical protein HPB47_013544 [Ixodes persulcatus]